MAFRVDFTELAVEDLESISKFIAEDNPTAAARVCGGLYNLALSLAANPLVGRITPEYNNQAIRDIVKFNYRLVYLVNHEKQRVEILRFWHGARGFLPSLWQTPGSPGAH
jgi:plasmid stabilization system protein ParE